MVCDKLAFVGTFVSSNSLEDLSIYTGFLTVENGKIMKKGSREDFDKLEKSGEFSKFTIKYLNDDQFLMPGFIDCHTHAPQFPNLGLGLDKQLLEWLDKYTFPLEKQYSDVKFAAEVYEQVVQRLISNGTTTACYFGSLHLEGTLELVKSAIKHRQRALIGKVSMNIENDAGYFCHMEKELADVVMFVEKVLAFKNDLVLPIITPRFAVSCDQPLMNGLAEISRQYGCRIQSHISENKKEIEHVLKINPQCASYGEIYDKSKILNNMCIMAHAIHLTEEEIQLFCKRGVSIAHCPASNTRLMSGICPVRTYLQKNIRVGLGTDVSGGDSASILDAMRRAMDVSTYLALNGDTNKVLNWKEVFYLATLGGAEALNLSDKIGNFEEGKELDALLVDVYASGGPIDRYPYPLPSNQEHAKNLVQRFLYQGDHTNIVQVYVKGVKVKDNQI